MIIGYSLARAAVFCTLALAIVHGLAVSGDLPSPQAGSQQVQFLEPSFDFGLLPPNRATTLQHDFVFRNVGDRDLLIKSLGTACRTVATCPKRQLAPRETSYVRLTTILPADYTKTESFQRNVRIETNDPVQPRIELVIKARFTYSLGWKPGKIEFGTLPPGGKAERIISVEAVNGAPFQISCCECSKSWFAAAEVQEVTTISLGGQNRPPATAHPLPPVSKRWIKVCAQPTSMTQPGGFLAVITVHTDRPDIPIFEIPATLNIASQWTVEPANLFLGIIRSPHPVEKEINIRTSIPGLKISGIECGIPGLDAKAIPCKGGYRVSVTYEPGQSNGPLEGSMIIRTSSSAVPEIKVGIQCLVKINE